MQQQPKNILIVTHDYPPHVGGIEMVAHNQAKRLAADGHEISVISSKIGGSKKQDPSSENITVNRISAFNGFEKQGIPFPIFSPSLLVVLAREVRKADVVHVHDAFYMSSFFAVLFARWYKKPIALTQHVDLISRSSKIVVFIQKLVYATTGAIVFSLSDVIMTYNDRVEQFLIKRNISQDKIISMPNGVDTDLFFPVGQKEKLAIRKKFKLDPTKKIVLFVGRFVPKKGFDTVLSL